MLRTVVRVNAAASSGVTIVAPARTEQGIRRFSTRHAETNISSSISIHAGALILLLISSPIRAVHKRVLDAASYISSDNVAVRVIPNARVSVASPHFAQSVATGKNTLLLSRLKSHLAIDEDRRSYDRGPAAPAIMARRHR